MQDTICSGSKVVQAGVDWITYTLPATHPQIEQHLQLFKGLHDGESSSGKETQATSPQGFQGQATGHVFNGQRNGLHMFRASAHCAHWLAEHFKAERVKIKCTRLDLEVTFQCPGGYGKWGTSVRDAIRNREAKVNPDSPTALTLYENHRRGDSFAIGARNSRRYVRGYDKTAEQHGKVLKNLVRIEAEYKRETARSMWKAVLNCENITVFAQQVLAHELQKNGVKVPWTLDAQPIAVVTEYDPKSEEKRMEWLLSQVAPAVRGIEDPIHRIQLKRAFGL